VKCIGMQNYRPDKNADLFWFQWCVGHLTDSDFIKLLRILAACLNENGFICIKDNFTSSGDNEFDKEDSSVTRSVVSFEKIIATSGLRVFEKEKQKNFPEMGLYPVYTYALRPI